MDIFQHFPRVSTPIPWTRVRINTYVNMVQENDGYATRTDESFGITPLCRFAPDCARNANETSETVFRVFTQVSNRRSAPRRGPAKPLSLPLSFAVSSWNFGWNRAGRNGDPRSSRYSSITLAEKSVSEQNRYNSRQQFRSWLHNEGQGRGRGRGFYVGIIYRSKAFMENWWGERAKPSELT